MAVPAPTTNHRGELIATFADMRLDFVDAAVLAVIDRHGEPRVATLDHRHFGVVRLAHADALELPRISGSGRDMPGFANPRAASYRDGFRLNRAGR